MSAKVKAAALAAATLLLGGALPAAAETVSDGFSVSSALSVTGIPASVSYGTVAPGATSGMETIDAHVTSNGPWHANVEGSGFAGPGSTTLPKSVRQLKLSQSGGIALDAPVEWRDFGDPSLEDAAPEATGGSGEGLLLRAELRVAVPATAPAGAYSGSIEIVVEAD